MFSGAKWAVRLVGWLVLGLLVNSAIPFKSETRIGEANYGPLTSGETMGRLVLWLILGAGVALFTGAVKLMRSK